MRRITRLILSLGLIATLTACQSQSGTMAPADTTHHSSAAKTHWDYSNGPNGPANWAKLDCPDCAGKMQSPIDIPADAPVKPADVTFSYLPTPLSIVNNGHTIQINSDGDSNITTNGKVYRLLQYHLHAPSEHHLAGKSYDMELHLVHKSDDGHYAVVAVMFKVGAYNKTLATFWDQLPKTQGKVNDQSQIAVNAVNLLPDNRDYYNYRGSFTTPPCTQGVNWVVLKTPVTLAADQLAAFTALYSHNNRPIQPLNGRF